MLVKTYSLLTITIVPRSGQSGCEDIFLVEDRVIYENAFRDENIVTCEDMLLDQG